MILVADSNHNRIIILDSNLQLLRILLSDVDSNLGFPYRMCIDPHDGRLIVGYKIGGAVVYSVRAKKCQRSEHSRFYSLANLRVFTYINGRVCMLQSITQDIPSG